MVRNAGGGLCPMSRNDFAHCCKVDLFITYFFFFAYFCLGILSIGKVLHSVEVERECETTALYLVEQLH